MAVKDILDKFRSSKEEKKQYFFALQADEELVKSAIWTVEKGIVKVLALGDSQSWEENKEFLEAVEASFVSAIGKIPEPNKVIFGLPRDWIQDNRIIPERTKLLKEISKKLGLTPIGFVVTTEAVTHHLKTIEGVPPTAILVGLRKGKITVTLAKLGKIIGTELVNRSDDFGEDLAEALSRFEAENIFPARILLYDSFGESTEELEDLQQELMNFAWEKEGVEFLHLPKIEILPSDFDIKAVALAGGREVAQANGIEVTSVDFGETMAEVGQPMEKMVAEPAETMGFFKEKDVAQEAVSEEVTEEQVKEKPRFNFSIISGFFSRIFSKIPRFQLPSRIFSFGVLIAVILLILGGGVLAFSWYVPKAEITLLVKPQLLEKDFTLKLDPSATSIDKDNLILPGEIIKKTVEGEKTKPTIGTKTVGEPAKGEVTVYNGTSNEKTFNSGTIIMSSSGVKFTLDDTVTVASQSGTAETPVSGKATVKITAVEIGTTGNFASGTEFTIANFAKSDFIAKNDSAFSGGTSRIIQIVAKEDQDKLLADLSEELKTKALADLSTQASLSKKIIPESLSSKITEKNFTPNIDEEANELKLNLKTEFSVLSYNEDDFKNLIGDEVKKAVPNGFEYQPEASEINFNLNQMTKKGIAIFTTHLKTKLIPKFDLEHMKKSLVGKNLVLAKQYLDNLANIESSEIKIWPRLPGRLVTLPHLTKNIKIEVKIE